MIEAQDFLQQFGVSYTDTPNDVETPDTDATETSRSKKGWRSNKSSRQTQRRRFPRSSKGMSFGASSSPTSTFGSSVTQFTQSDDSETEVSESSQPLIQDEDECKEAALRLLDAADRPTGALREKLSDRNFHPDTIEIVLQRLVEIGVVNNQRYAQRAVESCLKRHMGAQGTFMDLRRKGVDSADAREAIALAQQQDAFLQSAFELAYQVAHKTQGLDKQVRLRRFWSAGGRKGHASEDLRQAASIFNE